MEDYEQYIKNGDSFVKKEKFMDAIREYTKAYDSIKEDDLKAEICYKLSQCYFSLDHKSTENPLKYAGIVLDILHFYQDMIYCHISYCNIYVPFYSIALEAIFIASSIFSNSIAISETES